MNEESGHGAPTAKDKPQLHSSLTLLERAKAGDQASLELLIARYLPRMQRWASGRLPQWARNVNETQDLVQETLFRTFKRIERFEPRGEGALLAYLRKAIFNRINEEIRTARRRPPQGELDSQLQDQTRSPLEKAIGREIRERYERALDNMRPEDGELVVLYELGYTNKEIAELAGKPSANAARMAVERALVRLAREMGKTDV